MNNRELGLVIAGLGIVMILVMYSLVPIIKNAEQSECGCQSGDTCQYADRMPWQVYLSFSLIAVLFVVSFFLFTKDKPKKKKVVIPENLTDDERKIIDELVKQNGMIFQSEIVEKLDVSKVKVTRILDKLEGRGLIERRRRGMTNAIILKHSE
jgi:uncharacterized membrane protein